jgi:tetratricopeptide (TPR) repeat protein
VLLRLLSRIALLVVLTILVPNGARAEPTNFPQEARDRFDRGQDLQQQGRFREAIRAYEDAIRLGMKEFPRVHLYRADSFRDLKQYDAAIARYTQFLREFSLEDSCRH